MNTPDKHKILWGVRKGNEEWEEEILSTNETVFERVKELATKDGFGRFRISNFNMADKPNFVGTVKRS